MRGRIWSERPDLRESFLAGYGRRLGPDELVLLRACSAVAAVWMVGKARETGQPSFEHGSRLALRRLAAC